jgi:hypothetical protein
MVVGLAQLFMSQNKFVGNVSRENIGLWIAHNQIERLISYIKDNNLGPTCTDETGIIESPADIFFGDLKNCTGCTVEYQIGCYQLEPDPHKWIIEVNVKEPDPENLTEMLHLSNLIRPIRH